ncbi:MAG: hypothetical protein QUS33_01010 [Dehalococcoidia bacterium]|nr:hypothetical protein [Dehalococcoidia bacterium]
MLRSSQAEQPEEWVMLNEPEPGKASADLLSKWKREFRAFGWGPENYEHRIRQKLKEPLQLEEGEAVIFAATSGGWLVWVQGAESTEAGLALAIAGTNRRLIIWSSKALDSGLSPFRELRYDSVREAQVLTELRVGMRIHRFSGLIFVSFRDREEKLGIMVAGENERAALMGFLNEAAAMPVTVAAERSPGRGSAADSDGERRHMVHKSLTQGLEEVARKIRLLESEKKEALAKIEALEHDKRQAQATIEALERAQRQAEATIEALERSAKQAEVTIQELEQEKKQAAITIRGLERELVELGTIVAQASAKVDEILKDSVADDVSQPATVSAAEVSMSVEQSGTVSGVTAGEPKERSSKAWRFD